jgi:hypothetical protein
MKLKGLLGPTYALKSLAYDSQRCINMYPDADEMGMGKEGEPEMLTTVPGLTLTHMLPRSPIRALWRTANNYIYCIAGNGLYLLTPVVTGSNLTFTHTLLQTLTTQTGFCSICDGVPNYYQGVLNSGLINQVVVVDGSPTGYVFQEGTTSVYQMNSGTGYVGSNFINFQDGAFIFSQPNTITGYYASDPLNINDSNTIEVNLGSDNVSRIISDHDLIWVLGTRSLAVYQNTGGGTTTNQYQQIPGATAPHGCAAPWTVAQIAGQLLWLSNDDRGTAEVAMAFGYRAMRVSNHAVETWMESLGDLSQTIAWTYQMGGHSFYCLNNPNSTTTWCYDLAHKMWHERAYFSNGVYSRDLVQFHINCQISGYGSAHLCGDFQNGNIYLLDENNFTFNGVPIRRERRTPHQSGGFKRVFYSQFQLDVQAGQGLDGTGYSVQTGVGSPVSQTATNVLMGGNGPTYTLLGTDGTPQVPTGSVTVNSTGPTSNWSQSYTSNGNGTVTINSAPLVSPLLTIGNGNGVETDYQIQNIYPATATASIYVADWRGNNLQQQAPQTNQNLCLSSTNFGLGWTAMNCFPVGGKWLTPDYTQSAAGTYLTEDNTLNPHQISVPYTVVAGHYTNFSVYATQGAAAPTTTTLTGGVGTFSTEGVFLDHFYQMTLNTVFTNNTLALGDVVNCPALSTPNQEVIALISGTLGAAGSIYQLSPGWTTDQSSQTITASRTNQRYVQLAVQAGSPNPASAQFDLQTGTVVSSGNCTATITPITNFSGVYRCSIAATYAETGVTQEILTGYASCSASGSELTLTTPPQSGSVTIGAMMYVSGTSTGITISSVASGALNQPGSVYNLSAPAPFSAASVVQFGSATLALTPSAYISIINPVSTFPALTPYFQNYVGDGTSYVGIWGAQIGPQVGLLPLVQTSGIILSDQVTYTASEGLLVFELPPLAEVTNTTNTVVQAAAVITAQISATVPQLQPTEYMASFSYMEGMPTYTQIGTDPQVGLSYSKDGGYTYTDERLVPLGQDGNRFQRLIWRKLGEDRDRVWRITCSDPVNVAILGAEIMAKTGESAQ